MNLPNLIINIIIFTEAKVEYLECPTQQCNDSVLTMTCKVSSVGLVWTVEKYGYEVLFTKSSPVGSTDIEGPFKAVLTEFEPEVSTLSIQIDPSMNGMKVECIDGLNGGPIQSCTLNIISE